MTDPPEGSRPWVECYYSLSCLLFNTWTAYLSTPLFILMIIAIQVLYIAEIGLLDWNSPL